MMRNSFLIDFGAIVCWLGRLARKKDGRKAILIIKDDGLGDLILWLPYQAEIRKYYPAGKYRIDLLVKTGLADFAEQIPGVDRVLVLPVYRNRLQWTLFRIRLYLTQVYDVICNVTVSPHGVWFPYGKANLVTMLVKGSIFEAASSHFRNTVFVDKLTIRERYQAVLSFLGISSEAGKFDYTIFHSPLQSVSKPYCVICPGAGDSRRCWESEKYIHTVDRVLSEWDGTVMLVGTSREKELCERIRNLSKFPDQIQNLCGKLTIPALFSLIRQSNFLLSNDTGTCHIGAVTGVKTFIICGQGDYGSFVPYPKGMEGKQVFSIFSKRPCRCQLWGNEECRKQSVYPCIAEISADEVWEVIQKHIEIMEEV